MASSSYAGVPGLFHPLPLLPRSKRCVVSGWSRYDHDDPIWSDHPVGQDDDNIGIRLDGLAVADCDTPEFVALLRERAPSQVISQGRPGRASFWYMADLNLRSFSVPGFQFKTGRGHLMVVPDSIHPETGAPYRWIGERPLGPDARFYLDTAPAALLAEIHESRPGGAESDVPGWVVLGAGEGRNDLLTAAAGLLRRFGASPEGVRRGLLAWSQVLCCPATPGHEIDGIVSRSGGWDAPTTYEILMDD